MCPYSIQLRMRNASIQCGATSQKLKLIGDTLVSVMPTMVVSAWLKFRSETEISQYGLRQPAFHFYNCPLCECSPRLEVHTKAHHHFAACPGNHYRGARYLGHLQLELLLQAGSLLPVHRRRLNTHRIYLPIGECDEYDPLARGPKPRAMQTIRRSAVQEEYLRTA